MQVSSMPTPLGRLTVPQVRAEAAAALRASGRSDAELAVRKLDFFDPQTLTDTWSGTFGHSGMRAEVDQATSRIFGNVDDGVRSPWLRASINGRILAPDGGMAVGSFAFTPTLERGTLRVYHEYLKLDPPATGSGFGRAYARHMEGAYAAHGVDRLTVRAALTNGGYFWAQRGFDFADASQHALATPAVRAKRVARLVHDAHASGRISSAEAQALQPRLWPSAVPGRNEDALVSAQDLVALGDPGKRILRGSAWNGVRLLHV